MHLRIAMMPSAQKFMMFFSLMALCSLANWTLGQNPAARGGGATAEKSDVTAEELEKLAADAAANRAAAATDRTTAQPPREMNFLQLLMDGGPLMIPLVLISVLVLTVSLERLINLRAGRVMPRRLKRGLIEAAEQRFPVEPQELYQLGLRFPSVASRVLENMLKKVGRPVSEMETAVQDSCQREADRLYGTVRWLTAAAAIAPLLGLLGTVWGMILAFFETTQPGLGMNKTQQLAQGISIAFVNTLGGLSIAIPAAGFSHFFEGRIIKLMNSVEEHVLALVPRLERFEGVTRYDIELSGLVQRRRQDTPATPMATGSSATSAPPAAHDSDSGRPRDPQRTAGQPTSRQTRNR